MRRAGAIVTALLVLGLAGSALASGTLSGKYKTVIKNDPALGGRLNGTWVLALKSGKFHVTDNGHAVTHGTYTIGGNIIALEGAAGHGGCPAPGIYTFKLKSGGKKVTFSLIGDSKAPNCVGRRDVLVGHTFTKF